MSSLVLYRALGSPPARAVLMVTELMGLNVDIKEVNFIRFEHKTEEFKKLNPMGTVPVLKDGDFVVSESHAIMKYLVRQYGGDVGERLYPSDVRTRTLVDQMMFFDAGVFFTAFREAASTIFYEGAVEPSDKHKERIEAAYEAVERYLEKRQYLATDRLTLADLSCGSTATATQTLHTLDPKRYPRCYDWMRRLEEEPVFKTVNREGVQYFGKLVDLFKKNNAE